MSFLCQRKYRNPFNSLVSFFKIESLFRFIPDKAHNDFYLLEQMFYIIVFLLP